MSLVNESGESISPKVNDVKPAAPAIPRDAFACVNCLWARMMPENFECWVDPPRIVPRIIPSAIKGMPPQQGLISRRPAVQAHHYCSHFTLRPEPPHDGALPPDQPAG